MMLWRIGRLLGCLRRDVWLGVTLYLVRVRAVEVFYV